MKRIPAVSRRTYIISGTLFILLAIFGYYFFIFMPDKEKNLIAQRVRALERIGENFQEKYAVYKKNIKEVVGEESTIKGRLTDLSKLNIEIKRDKVNLKMLEKRDSLSFEELESLDSVLQSKQKKADSLVNVLNDTLKNMTVNKKIRLINEDKRNDLATQLNNILWFFDTLTLTFATDFESFFSPLMLESSFHGYIVYQDSALIYQDIPGEVLRVPSHLYTELDKNQSTERKYVRHNLEERRPETYQTPRVYEAGTNVQLGANDYRLFCIDYIISNIDNQTRWTIYGLVTEDHFEAEKKKIPFFGVVFLSIGLLLLLFAMPLLKLFFMSSIERLNRQDALLIPLAFILCLAFIVLLFLISGKYYLSDIPKIDHKLEVLADTIEKQLKQEILEINNFTQQFDNQTLYKPDTVNDNKSDTFNSISILKLLKNSNDSTVDLFNLAEQFYKQILYKPDTFNSISISKLLLEETTNGFTVDPFGYYPYFRLIYWLDDKGDQQFGYSMLDKEHDNRKLNYVDRKYFTAVQQKETFLNDELHIPFFLESIYSWTTGEPASVFSRPAYQDTLTFADTIFHNTSVLAVSTVLYSLTELVLPTGYSFSIIDEEGLVLYHTDRQKNLQENYLQEINHNGRIESAKASQTEAFSDINYYNRNYRAHITPLSYLPSWYLITTYDKEYIQGPYQYILSFSMMGIILISMVVVLQFCLIILIYHRRSKLKRKQFAFEWLWPYQKGGRKSRRAQKLSRPMKYTIVFGLNILYVILLIYYNRQVHPSNSFLLVIASFIYATVLSNAVAFALLKEKRDIKYWAVLAGSVAIIFIIYIITLNLTPGENLRYWVVLLFIAFLFVFISHVLEDLKVEKGLIMVQSGMIGRKVTDWITSRFTKLRDSAWISRNSYCCMIFSFIMLSSCLPVWFLCSKAYEQEKLIWEKYSLYQISEGLKDRDAWLKANYKINDKEFNLLNEKFSRYDSAKHKALYYQALDVNVLHPKGLQSKRLPPFDTSDSLQRASELEEILYLVRPVLTDLTSVTNGFIHDKGKNWSALLPSDNLMAVSFEGNSYFPNQPPLVWNPRPILNDFAPKFIPVSWVDFSQQPDLVLATVAPKFISISWTDLLKRHWLPVILFIIFLYAIYLLLASVIKRLFGTSAFQFPKIIQIDDEQMDTEMQTLIKQENDKKPLPYHKFIISMPFAGTYELYDKDNSQIHKVDLSQALEDYTFPTALDYVFKQEVVLEHFSYGIEDPVANQHRLRLLESLLASGKCVTIISKLTPMQITAKYEELIETTQDQQVRKDLETRVSRWKDILSSFVKLYYSKLVCSRNRTRLPVNASLKDLIYYEMSINRSYFKRMDGTMVKKWEDDPDNIKLSKSLEEIDDPENEDVKEEILLKIQSMAQPFYFSLWNSCAKEEKYILYDLAVDGFVNTEDKVVLLKLMEKGLIYYDESFHIMNESFRNFILTNIKPTEALAMEKELRKKGQWSMYSTVIILVIVSMIFFVLFAQETVVNQFTALLAGMAATIPYLLRLNSVFTSSSTHTDR